ncbi:hypothetical protein CBI33_27035 [Rhodococcus erythropolis]|nr:hypothetical protein CBI33_27035 [Rhodococcus erythropolis]
MPLTTKQFAPKKSWREPAMIAAGAVAVLVAIFVMASACGGDNPPPPVAAQGGDTAETASSGAATSTASTVAKGSLVPQVPEPARSSSDADWLTRPPQGISWQRVDGVPLPFSASDGPTDISGALASGYTHTPQGAAVAALQISMRLIFSPDFAAVVNHQTSVSEDERRQLLTARSAQPSIDADAVGASTLQPAAFKVGDYSDAAATIYFAYPTQTGSYRVARTAVEWSGGDWKYTGRMSSSAPELPDTTDLSTFTRL